MLQLDNKKDHIFPIVHYKTILLGSWLTYIYFIGFYLINLFIARKLNSAADFGDYSVTISTMMLIAVTLLMGQDQYVLQVISQYLEKRKYSFIKGYIRFTFVLFVIAILVSFIISISFYFIYSHNYPKIAVHPIWIGFSFIPSIFSTLFLLNYITAQGKYIIATVFYRIIFPCIMLLLLAFCAYFNFISSLTFIIITGVCWIILSILLFYNHHHKLDLEITKAIPEYEIKHWILGALPLWVRGYFIYIMNTVGIIALEFLNVPEEYVGIFSVAFQIAGLVTVWSANIGRYFFTMIAPFSDDKKTVQHYLTIRSRFIFVVVTIFVLILLIFSKQILAMFGPIYITGLPVLYILLFGFYIHVLSNFSMFILQLFGYFRLLLYSQLLFSIIIISLTILLINYWGMIGAALGFTVPVVVMDIFYYFVVYYYLGLRVL